MAAQAMTMRSFLVALLMAMLVTAVRVDEDPSAPADDEDTVAAPADDAPPSAVDKLAAETDQDEHAALVKAAGHLENAAKLSAAAQKKAVEKKVHQEDILQRLAKEQAEALAKSQATKDEAVAQSERAEAAEQDKAVKDEQYKTACKDHAAKTSSEVVGRASAMAAATAEARVTEEYASVDSAEVQAEAMKDTADAKAEVAAKAAKKAALAYEAADKDATQKSDVATEAADSLAQTVEPMKAAQAARAAARAHMHDMAEAEKTAMYNAGIAKGHFQDAQKAKASADAHHKDAVQAEAVTGKIAAREKAAADEAEDFAAAGKQVKAEKQAMGEEGEE